jgi:hypothetical protein
VDLLSFDPVKYFNEGTVETTKKSVARYFCFEVVVKYLLKLLLLIIFEKKHKYSEYLIESLPRYFITVFELRPLDVPYKCFHNDFALQPIELPSFVHSPVKILCQLLNNFIENEPRVLRQSKSLFL